MAELEEKKPTKRLIVEKVTGKAPLLNQIQNFDLTKVAVGLGMVVDPDGLASQAAMCAIIEKLGGKAEPFYRGTINRPQNRTAKELLSLNPRPLAEFKQDEGYTCIISVDGPSTSWPVIPHFIIDHHEQAEPALVGNDVRSVGSASAILWEYAIEAGIDFTTEEGSKLATALALGIITDTRNGAEESCTELDYEALAHCLKHKNNKLYRDVLNYPKPAYYNDMFAQGWANRKTEGTVLVTGLGSIPSQRSGVISDLAEKFAETADFKTVVVFAMVDGDIEISMRTSNSAINADEFMKNAFYEGGGKRGAGGSKLGLPAFLKKGVPDTMVNELYKSISSIITHKALQIAGDGVREVKEEPNKS